MTGDYNLTASVTYQNGNLSAGGTNVGYPYYDWYQPIYTYCYPTYITPPEKSKVEQAFKIVGKLLEKKIIEKLNVREFIELVNEIAGIV